MMKSFKILTMEQRREVLKQRLIEGKGNDEDLMKDLVDPLMVPRIDLAFSKINGH